MFIFTGKIHYNFALLIWILVQSQVPHWLNPIPFLIGSVFPDADIRYSLMGRFVPLWLFFNHRGFTHTLPALIVFSIPVYFISFKWMCLFAAGYLLHLMIDDGTPMRVKWIKGHKKRRTI